MALLIWLSMFLGVHAQEDRPYLNDPEWQTYLNDPEEQPALGVSLVGFHFCTNAEGLSFEFVSWELPEDGVIAQQVEQCARAAIRAVTLGVEVAGMDFNFLGMYGRRCSLKLQPGWACGLGFGHCTHTHQGPPAGQLT